DDFYDYINNGEINLGTSFSYADFNTGVMWNMLFSPTLHIFAGVGAFHLTQPNESFLKDINSKLNTRYTFNGGAKYVLNEQWGLLPSILIMSQSKAQEINIGMLLANHTGQGLPADPIVYFGTMFRTSIGNTNTDAILPSVGIKVKNIQAGLSYDINISSLRGASNLRGGMELAIIYISDFARPLPVKAVIPCLRY
ncbi:MAG: type IX secretion system membrane protein PorP/SprF, partial [Bacteroidetes bacterium]|nr:type IX secretion system membrane protein PorP/SprF [Bacteroidota bacterium]